MTCVRGILLGLSAAAAAGALWPGAGLAWRQDNQATTVDAVTAVGRVPVPVVGEGAPLFTPDELQEAQQQARSNSLDASDAVNRCRGFGNPRLEEDGIGIRAPRDYLQALYNTEQQAYQAMNRAAEAARLASEAALAARSGAANDQVPIAEVERTELERQAAVNTFVAAREAATEARLRVADLQGFMQDEPQARWQDLRALVESNSQYRADTNSVQGVFIPPEYSDLRLSELSVRQLDRDQETVLAFSGRINNTRRRAIAVPPLWFTAVDSHGFAIKSEQTNPRGRNRIPAGGSVPFAYEMKPAPPTAATAVVTFAPDSGVSSYLPVGLFCNTDAERGID